MANTRKPYVIRIAPEVPASFLTLASDEGDEPTGPARTSDEALALKFTNFTDARAELRAQVKMWPGFLFRLGLADNDGAQA